jgi:hypothetical protein
MCSLMGNTEAAAVLVADGARPGKLHDAAEVRGPQIGCGADVAPTI